MNDRTAFCFTFLDPLETADLAVEDDLAGIAAIGINAAENVHQRRFSCAVFSAQGMNFSFFYNKIHIVQRLDAWERLCDMLHFKNCLAHSITLFFVYRSFPHIGSSDPCTAAAVHGLPVCNLYSTIPAQVSSALS